MVATVSISHRAVSIGPLMISPLPVINPGFVTHITSQTSCSAASLIHLVADGDEREGAWGRASRHADQYERSRV